jgi:prevent-host-death family protein
VNWQLQEAKQRFSELVRRTLDEGPQVVTRHGQDVVVVLAADTYRRLTGQVPDFKSFLLAAPDLSLLDLDQPERDLPCDDVVL